MCNVASPCWLIKSILYEPVQRVLKIKHRKTPKWFRFCTTARLFSLSLYIMIAGVFICSCFICHGSRAWYILYNKNHPCKPRHLKAAQNHFWPCIMWSKMDSIKKIIRKEWKEERKTECKGRMDRELKIRAWVKRLNWQNIKMRETVSIFSENIATHTFIISIKIIVRETWLFWYIKCQSIKNEWTDDKIDNTLSLLLKRIIHNLTTFVNNE